MKKGFVFGKIGDERYFPRGFEKVLPLVLGSVFFKRKGNKEFIEICRSFPLKTICEWAFTF